MHLRMLEITACLQFKLCKRLSTKLCICILKLNLNRRSFLPSAMTSIPLKYELSNNENRFRTQNTVNNHLISMLGGIDLAHKVLSKLPLAGAKNSRTKNARDAISNSLIITLTKLAYSMIFRGNVCKFSD